MNFTPRPTLTGRAVRCGTPNGGTWPTVSLSALIPRSCICSEWTPTLRIRSPLDYRLQRLQSSNGLMPLQNTRIAGSCRVAAPLEQDPGNLHRGGVAGVGADLPGGLLSRAVPIARASLP